MHNEKQKAVLIIIAIVLFVLIVLLAMHFKLNNHLSPNKLTTLDLPLITTYNESSETGENVEVKIYISLGGSERTLSKISDLNYTGIVINSVQDIDYEDIISGDGIDIIKEEVKSAINENLTSDEINSVYVTGLYVDRTNKIDFIDEGEKSGYNSRGEQFNKLFGN